MNLEKLLSFWDFPTLLHIVLFWMMCSFVSCDSSIKRLNSDFELSWVHSEKFRIVRYRSEGITDSYIFAAGIKDDFLLAKQQPLEDIGKTMYYIIDIIKFKKEYGKMPERQGVYGPLDLVEFNNMKLELKVPENFEYTINFKRLEK